MARARLPERGSRLASQAVVDPSGLLPQAQAQAVPSPRVGCGDPPPFSPLREPQLLIRVVATPKADFLRAILCQHTLEHFHREEGAERESSSKRLSCASLQITARLFHTSQNCAAAGMRSI